MCRGSRVALDPSLAEAVHLSQLQVLMAPLFGSQSDADEQVLQSYTWNLTLAVNVLSLLSASALLGFIDNEVIRISQSVYYVRMRVVSYYSVNLLAFGGFARLRRYFPLEHSEHVNSFFLYKDMSALNLLAIMTLSMFFEFRCLIRSTSGEAGVRTPNRDLTLNWFPVFSSMLTMLVVWFPTFSSSIVTK